MARGERRLGHGQFTYIDGLIQYPSSPLANGEVKARKGLLELRFEYTPACTSTQVALGAVAILDSIEGSRKTR